MENDHGWSGWLTKQPILGKYRTAGLGHGALGQPVVPRDIADSGKFSRSQRWLRQRPSDPCGWGSAPVIHNSGAPRSAQPAHVESMFGQTASMAAAISAAINSGLIV